MLKISLKTVVPSSFGAGLASYCLKMALQSADKHDKSPRRAHLSTSVHVSGVSEKVEFSPFARETFPLALEHAWG